MTEEKPELDYWMLEILGEALHKHKVRNLSQPYASDSRSRYNPIGRINLVLDRLEEIQEYQQRIIESGLRRPL